MRIVEDISAEVPDTNACHWDLKALSEDTNEETVLMYGYNSCCDRGIQEKHEDFKRKIYFNNWAPCEFFQYRDHHGRNAINYDEYFDEIYSICPYTSHWLNSQQLGRTYKPIFYPFNKSIIPLPSSKLYDVIYHGGIHGIEHLKCLKIMSEFNYRYVTMTHHINQTTINCLPYATNTNLKFQDKINLVAQTKISVCYNIVHVTEQHIDAMKSYDSWEKNIAFGTLGKWNIVPQFKTRMHEAAISKTLNLVQRDSWNIAEAYYDPDTEFIYFNDEGDLRNKITEILANWEDYDEIVQRAYKKAMNYTTDKFIERIRNDT